MTYGNKWREIVKYLHLKQIVFPNSLLFAGDYEVVGPDPALGHQEVAALGANMILIHYHHRHEFAGGGNKGLWGKSMLDAHRTMNITHREFMSVIDDVMRALEKNMVGKTEQNELLGLLFSLKDQVLHQ